jgi:hypothetical protein
MIASAGKGIVDEDELWELRTLDIEKLIEKGAWQSYRV